MQLARRFTTISSLIILMTIVITPSSPLLAAATEPMLRQRISEVNSRINHLDKVEFQNLRRRIDILRNQAPRHSISYLGFLSSLFGLTGFSIGMATMSGTPLLGNFIDPDKLIVAGTIGLGSAAVFLIAMEHKAGALKIPYDQLMLHAANPFSTETQSEDINRFRYDYDTSLDALERIENTIVFGDFTSDQALRLMETVIKFRNSHQKLRKWIDIDSIDTGYKFGFSSSRPKDFRYEELNREYARILADELIRRIHAKATVTEGHALWARLQALMTKPANSLPTDDGCHTIIRLVKADRWI